MRLDLCLPPAKNDPLVLVRGSLTVGIIKQKQKLGLGSL